VQAKLADLDQGRDATQADEADLVGQSTASSNEEGGCMDEKGDRSASDLGLEPGGDVTGRFVGLVQGEDVHLTRAAAGLVATRGSLSILNGGCGPVLTGGGVSIRNGGCGPVLAKGDVSIQNGIRRRSLQPGEPRSASVPPSAWSPHRR
jgi:hypothetical protein